MLDLSGQRQEAAVGTPLGLQSLRQQDFRLVSQFESLETGSTSATTTSHDHNHNDDDDYDSSIVVAVLQP